MSVRDKVRASFKQLRNDGYFARMNFWCCQSCGWAAIPEEKSEKVVFYHNQDNEAFNDDGDLNVSGRDKLFLAWKGDGNHIVNVLKSNGLAVEWDGSENTRIAVTGDTP